MKDKAKKIGNIFLNSVLAIIVLITIIFGFSFVRMKTTKQRYVNVFGYSIMQVVTRKYG